MSYVTSNVLSNGDYATEHVFYGLPDDDGERARYRELLATLEGTRYVVISRSAGETLYGDDYVPGDRSHDESESELSVIVRPSVTWVADMLRHTGVTESDSLPDDGRRYYTDGSTSYYASGVRNGIPTPVAMEESYCVDVHGLSAGRLAVIEQSAGIK